MSTLLGIDTGGTYTDAVLLDTERGVISTAKALTTKHNLLEGIQHAVRKVLPHPPPGIDLVSLSSTLATNAIVEGKGNSICLILIGYDPQMVADMGFERLVDARRIVFIQGGHTVDGEEQSPLDLEAARRAILSHAPYVAAFAISSFFGVYNPSHELEVKRLVRRLTNLPVTCGHELTTKLDAPLRALTVALNARLIPLLRELILAVQQLLASEHIQAPLMVVKGDGSLVDAEMALQRPVETILSGPAASVIGALHLGKEKDAFVIDMGGTTTDIAAVHHGRPALNLKGAKVGGWQTMVEAVDIHTTGLGGDSEIKLDETGSLRIGPRRVVPLSLLATSYPSVVEALRRQLEAPPDNHTGSFVLHERPLGPEQDSLTSAQREVWDLLSAGPMPIAELAARGQHAAYLRYSLDGLLERGLIAISSFTPTDAVHVLGKYRVGSVEAASIGAELWARRLGMRPRKFCQRVVEQVIIQAGRALLESALSDEAGLSLSSRDSVGQLLINRALEADGGGNFAVKLWLRRPIIGLGAPAATYLAPLAEKLNTPLYIPEHAAVASAIGAVASGVVQKVRLLIRPQDEDETYRVYSPSGVRDFSKLADATSYARRTARRLARERAGQAGARRIKVHLKQRDVIVPVVNDQLFLEAEVIATAVGRPRLKEEREPPSHLRA
ncbi:MAG TPA: hydantoinase/oxoprolinase family protein [Dehalococcoidia bacterium]|nr:hydantoinase/oxoprolinase family protein [Dehalococcoidia bacterium]